MWTPLMPDMRDVIEEVRNARPDLWAATNQNTDDDRFVRACVVALNEADGTARWGLNGKRGTDTISTDCVAYLNPTVNPDLPSNQSCETADVIVRHGSPSATVGWNNITVPISEGGTGAKWIPAGDEPPPDGDLARRVAVLEHDVAVLQAQVQVLADKLVHGFDVSLLAHTGHWLSVQPAEGDAPVLVIEGRAKTLENQPASWERFYLKPE